MKWLDRFRKKPALNNKQTNLKYNNLKILPNGDIQLNPDSYHTLTLYNTSAETVFLIQQFFVENVNGLYPEDNLRHLFMKQFVGVREFDTIRKSQDCFPLYTLCEKYSPEVMELYFRDLRYDNYVRKLDSQDRQRPFYENMVKYGLAICGDSIPFNVLAASLGRDQLREIGKKFNVKGKRGNIDTANSFCEHLEIREHFKSIIPYNHCFMVQKTSETEIAVDCYNYICAKAEWFYRTYMSYFSRYKTIMRAAEAMEYGAIEGLQYRASACCSDECKLRDGEIYSIEEAKKIKFKPDCGCDLLPYNSSWKN